jgi:DNA-binding NarL/FixJ family response regulator
MSASPATERRRLTLVIVEDHEFVRAAIEMLLRKQGHYIVGRAGDAAGGYDAIIRTNPDVALVACPLHGRGGADLVRRLRAARPALPVLLYTGSADEDVVRDALRSGAAGLLLKTGSPTELDDALVLVADGGTYVDPRIEPLVDRSARAPLLSPREREILGLLAGGWTGGAAATRLGISRETVKTHVRNANSKLGVTTRAAAVAKAIELSEIENPY